jgi:hypothetical protein
VSSERKTAKRRWKHSDPTDRIAPRLSPSISE